MVGLSCTRHFANMIGATREVNNGTGKAICVPFGKTEPQFEVRRVQRQWRSVMKNFVWLLAGAVLMITSRVEAQNFAIEETTIASVQQALQSKARSCRQIVQAYLDRIAAYDRNGPALNSILTLNPKALAEADRLDTERATGAAIRSR